MAEKSISVESQESKESHSICLHGETLRILYATRIETRFSTLCLPSVLVIFVPFTFNALCLAESLTDSIY